MLSRNQIKEIRSLKQKKFRQKYDKFVVEGHKTSIEFIKSGAYGIESIFAREGWIHNNQHLLGNYHKRINPVSEKEMDRITLLTTSSDVLLVCKRKGKEVNDQLKDIGFAFYLDEVQDPGNVGAIFRIADWFGMKYVFLSENTVDEYNPKVIQSSRGSICNIHIIRDDIRTLKKQHIFHVVGAAMEGNSTNNYNWRDDSVIILGNEGSGMTDGARQSVDDVVSIPGASSRIAESLNVASAASIFAYATMKAKYS